SSWRRCSRARIPSWHTPTASPPRRRARPHRSRQRPAQRSAPLKRRRLASRWSHSPYRLPRRMRFFGYGAREIVKRAGSPVTDYGFTTDAAAAGEIATRIGGPTVIKSQVLSGGRMKAGGVKFADTPAQAEAYAREILALEIGGQKPRGVLVDPKAEVEQEDYAGVVWDGTRKQPVMIFSPVGGIGIEQVAEQQPEAVGRRHFSNLLPFSDFQAKEVIAAT